jgi:hypothetical protein
MDLVRVLFDHASVGLLDAQALLLLLRRQLDVPGEADGLEGLDHAVGHVKLQGARD